MSLNVILATVGIVTLLLVAGIYGKHTIDIANDGPWYLGCADSKGQEYLIKVEDKPVVKDGFIFIGDGVFLTPMPMMTCRSVRVKDVEDEKKLLPIT